MENEVCVNLNKQKGRNYGIDLLRIVSMFMICVMHVLGTGGVLDNTTIFSLNYEIAWSIECIVYCAVNCYALISGFVGANSKYKFTNIVKLWLQVVFYSVVITGIFAIIKPEVINWEAIVGSFLPIIFNRYWYFTAYFLLFLFMPILNIALNSLSKKQLEASLVLIVAACCILTIPNGNLFYLNKGYSALWLIVLYLVGGYVKKCEPFKEIKSKVLIIALIVIFVLIWASKLCIELTTTKLFGEAKRGGVFIKYVSPLVFATALIMLELFSRIKFAKKPSVISALASVSFGVYLIHCHPILSNELLYDLFKSFATYNPALLVLAVIGAALAIYLICSAIDYLRLLLFKLIRVPQALDKIELKIKNKFFKDETDV